MIIGSLLKNDVEQLYNDNAGATAAEQKQSINSGGAGIQLNGTPVACGEAPANALVTIAGLTIPAPRDNGAVSTSANADGGIDAAIL